MASWKGIHLSFSVFLHCGTWTSENGAVSVIAQQVVVPGVGALHTEHGAPCALGNLPIMDQQWRTAGMAVFLTMKSGLLSTPNPDFFLKTLVTTVLLSKHPSFPFLGWWAVLLGREKTWCAMTWSPQPWKFPTGLNHLWKEEQLVPHAPHKQVLSSARRGIQWAVGFVEYPQQMILIFKKWF